MDVVHRIVVRLLKHCCVLRSNKAGGVSIPLIEEGNGAVVRASDQDIRVLGREDK